MMCRAGRLFAMVTLQKYSIAGATGALTLIDTQPVTVPGSLTLVGTE